MQLRHACYKPAKQQRTCYASHKFHMSKNMLRVTKHAPYQKACYMSTKFVKENTKLQRTCQIICQRDTLKEMLRASQKYSTGQSICYMSKKS